MGGGCTDAFGGSAFGKLAFGALSDLPVGVFAGGSDFKLCSDLGGGLEGGFGSVTLALAGGGFKTMALAGITGAGAGGGAGIPSGRGGGVALASLLRLPAGLVSG